MVVMNSLLKIILIIIFILTIVLFFYTLFNDKKKNLLNNILLIFYELFLVLMTYLTYKWSNLFFDNITILLSLIFNTISLLTLNIKLKIKKELNIVCCIISIITIIFGLLITFNYSQILIRRTSLTSEKEINIMMSLDDFTASEASDLLSNIYIALNNNKDNNCLKLYKIEKDNDKENEYFINIYETCSDLSLPSNEIKMIIDNKDKTKINKIYWNFKNEIEFTLYEDNKQVENYDYLFNLALNTRSIPLLLKDAFEQDITAKLIPSDYTKITYTDINYSTVDNYFYYNGTVESQTTKKSIVTEEFVVNIKMCEEKCSVGNYNYSWYFISPNYDQDNSIIK